MKIISGLFDHMVMQRNTDNVCEQKITGTAAAHDTDVTLTCAGFKAISKTDSSGAFELTFKGLPPGGPYIFTLSCATEDLQINDVLVGDVWILAGQSNMEGIGNIDKGDTPDEHVRAYFMGDEWDIAKDPITCLDEAKAEIHRTLRGGHNASPRNPKKGVGPGLSFGKRMHGATGVPQGLIACAHGGTRMSQWDSAKADSGNNSLYGAMMNRIKRNGGTVAGMLWYQGCSDANVKEQESYYARTKTFFEAVRHDLAFPDMPLVIAQIGRVISASEDDLMWTLVRNDQQRMQKEIRHTAMVPTVDLDLDDAIHLSGSAQITLGNRMAEAMRSLRHEPESQPMPVEFDSLETSVDPSFKLPVVRLKFKNVSGRLECRGSRPCGLSVIAGERAASLIFRTELDGDTVVLKLTGALPLPMLEAVCAWGCDNFCNIYDQAGRPIPAFGPIRLSTSHIATPFAKKLQVSKGITEMSFEDSQYLADAFSAFEYRDAECVSFYAFPRDMAETSGKNHLRIFRTAYDFPCGIVTEAGFGYDGPVHLFMDGKKIFSDHDGTNPIICDQAKITLDIPAGRHEFYAVLDAKYGNSWGISLILRNTKLDYSPELTREDVKNNLPAETGFTNDNN